MDSTNVINLYEKLLDLETSNHNTFIMALLGIVVILLGATWWWNKQGVKRYINSKITKIFEKELKDLKKNNEKYIKKVTETEINKYKDNISSIRAEHARTMGIVASNNDQYSHAITWWVRALENRIECESGGEAIRIIVNAIIDNIDKLKNADSKEEEKKSGIYEIDYVLKTIELIPPTLNQEKKKIIKDLKGRKELYED